MLSVGFSGSGGKELSFQTTLNVLFCGLDFYAFVVSKRLKMYSNFKKHAMEYVKQAVQEDDAGNYSKAFPLLYECIRVLQDPFVV
jgi:hypothetical protein